MSNLKAFVAHSFNPTDKKVIDEFLAFFDSLKKTHSFVWDHAEEAELKAVSKKVKEKMENKDLFIAILTGKHFQIAPNKIKHFFSFSYGKRQDFLKSPSDWIIQESGYALAKEMKLLFLVEDDLNCPEGLQADLEYIPFQRDNPSGCFVKLNQMIGSLLEETKEITITPENVKSVEPIKEEDDKAKVDTGLQKTESKQMFIEAYHSLGVMISEKKSPADEKMLLEKIKLQFEHDSILPPIYWDCLFLSLKIRAGSESSLAELRTLSIKENSYFPFKFLADYYKEARQYSEAIKYYLIAREKDSTKSLFCFTRASECYALDKNKTAAYNLLLKALNPSAIPEEAYRVYKALAEISELLKDFELFESFGEKALDLFPYDHELRFSLAHHYGEKNNNQLSLYHYDFLCRNHPNGANLNNIGVIYAALDIKSKAIESYNAAVEKYQETLSSANLAFDYINAGFLIHASEKLNAARRNDKYHENVDKAFEEISRVRNKDNETILKTLKNAEPPRSFMVRFAEAYSIPCAIDIHAVWKFPHGEIPFKVSGEEVTGEGLVKTEYVNALAVALQGGSYSEHKERRLKFIGTIKNRAIIYQLTVSTVPPPSTFLTGLSGGTSSYVGLMIISENSLSIEVFERKEDDENPVFYEVRRV